MISSDGYDQKNGFVSNERRKNEQALEAEIRKLRDADGV